MSAHTFTNSFNAGEITPLADSRVDLAQYKAGCRVLQNMIPLPFGGAISRPGMQYLGAAKDSDREARVVAFNFSTTTNFVLEFGHLYIRFWTNAAQVLSGAVPLEIVTEYREQHLFQIQFRQLNDVVYIVHPNYHPAKLTRVADDDWTLADVDWQYPPLQDENVEAATLAASAATGTGVILTASVPMFDVEQIGAFFQVSHSRAEGFTGILLTGNNTGSWLSVIGKWDFFTFGSWGGTVHLQRTYDGGTTVEAIRVFNSNQDRNVTASGEEFKWCQLRIVETNFTGSAATTDVATPRALLEIQSTRWNGLVKITAVNSATEAVVDVIDALYDVAATALWAEGSFSTYRGFPRSIDMHEQRILYGGTAHQPNTIWGSVSADFDNFRRTTNDDGSFAYTIATDQANAIQWLASQAGLIVGTSGEEWLMQASSTSEAITPTNVTFKRQSRYGSSHLPPAVINNLVLFVQRSGRKIRELQYSFASDSYVAPDLTLLAEHLTRSGIKQVAYQSHPDSVLWVVTDDGQLVGMTYEPEQKVAAWHRHVTDGEVESLAIIYGDSPGSDEIWLIVKRTIENVAARYVERLYPLARHYMEQESKEGSFYVDSGTQLTNAVPSSVVTGLDWLEGKEVSILADGAVQPRQPVLGGVIALIIPATRVTIGLPFTAEVQPMKPDLALPDGTMQGRKVKIDRAAFRLWNTLGLEWTDAPELGDWLPLPFRDTSDPMDSSPPLFTGEKEVSIGGGFEESINLAVRQTDPLPLGLLGIIYKFNAYGN